MLKFKFKCEKRYTNINMTTSDYFKVNKSGISPFQTMVAYLGGSAFQTVIDNPLTTYRQLVQQYAKDIHGNIVDPKQARLEATRVFRNTPIRASLSGVGPRLVGVGFKRVPKFGFFLGISYVMNEGDAPGLATATAASIFSAPFINPIRMIEKQQRAYFKQTGAEKPILEIIKESAAKNYKPLFRGTVPLMGHSIASATTGLVGQPQLQKYLQKKLHSSTNLSHMTTGLLSSAIVSPIYVMITNPLSRLEVIMQTTSIQGKRIHIMDAIKEVANDTRKNGMRGLFRGQGIGTAKAVVSLTLFHQGRIFLTDHFKERNLNST